MDTYTFSVNLHVHDPADLYRAALANFITDNGHSEETYAAAEDMFGTESEPNIGNCLIQMLDPGSLAGCSIDSSYAQPAP